jgi:endonuclease YncB( thermonuclease family)
MSRRRLRPRRIAALVLAGLAAAGLWAGGRAMRPSAERCRVDRVVDGDSLRLTCAGKVKEVRLHCIDAPEQSQSPWGKRSRAHLIEIAPREVELVALDLDRFGRVVGDVYAPGSTRRLLNLEQVRAGQAAVYDRYCTDGRFAKAERAARKARQGIWSRPGEQQTPWIYRHRRYR